MKKPAQHPIAEVPRRQTKVEMTIGIDLGDVWSWAVYRSAVLAHKYAAIVPEPSSTRITW
jgi:hypothetical protein